MVRIVAIALGLSLTACSPGDAPSSRPADGPMPGAAMPALELTDLGGQPFDLARLEGRVVVLNLWATWCAPCRDEMPELEALQADYDPADLRVVGLSVDTIDPARVVAFLEENGYTYLNLLGDLGALVDALGVDPGIPHTFLIDRSGRIQGYWRGRFRPFEPSTAARIRSVVEDV